MERLQCTGAQIGEEQQRLPAFDPVRKAERRTRAAAEALDRARTRRDARQAERGAAEA